MCIAAIATQGDDNNKTTFELKHSGHLQLYILVQNTFWVTRKSFKTMAF